MSVSIESLVKSLKRSDIVSLTLDVLDAFGFPVTNWDEKSPPRAIIESGAETILVLAAYIPEIAKFGRLAKGKWLDLYLWNHYGKTRNPAKATKLMLRLTNTSLSQVDFFTGELLVTPDKGKHVFTNVSNGSLLAPDGSTLTTEFIALEAGGAYNLTGGAWSLVSDIPGVTVADTSPPTITQYGIDEEKDGQAYARASDEWGKSAAGGSRPGIRSIAREASDEVRKVAVLPNYPTPSSFTVLLASDTGGVSVDAVNAVKDQLKDDGEDLKPICSHENVDSATEQPIEISGTACVLAEEMDAVRAYFEARVLEYQIALPIGAKVSREKISGFITEKMSDDQKNDVSLAQPAGDIQMSASAVAVFDHSLLVWESV